MADTYSTKSGDTWDLIAYEKLGSCFLVDKLIEENPAYVDTVIFPAGVKLTIPDVSEATSNQNLPPWRQ